MCRGAASQCIFSTWVSLLRLHYKEYIVYLINKHNIDPLVIMTEDELRLQCTRFEKNVPNKRRKESAQQYRQRVIQVSEQWGLVLCR